MVSFLPEGLKNQDIDKKFNLDAKQLLTTRVVNLTYIYAQLREAYNN